MQFFKVQLIAAAYDNRTHEIALTVKSGSANSARRIAKTYIEGRSNYRLAQTGQIDVCCPQTDYIDQYGLEK